MFPNTMPWISAPHRHMRLRLFHSQRSRLGVRKVVPIVPRSVFLTERLLADERTPSSVVYPENSNGFECSLALSVMYV